MLASDFRLKKTSDFNRVKEKGKLYQSENFGVTVLEKDKDEPSRFGFVISTKISKLAAHRNRIKRAFGEAVRQNFKKISKGYDMVFLAKTTMEKKTTDEIMKQVKDFIDGLNNQ